MTKDAQVDAWKSHLTYELICKPVHSAFLQIAQHLYSLSPSTISTATSPSQYLLPSHLPQRLPSSPLPHHPLHLPQRILRLSISILFHILTRIALIQSSLLILITTCAEIMEVCFDVVGGGAVVAFKGGAGGLGMKGGLVWLGGFGGLGAEGSAG